jgi:hypothetical protein
LFQPSIGAEIAPLDAEISFMEESPPGLWPENQNSNLGLVRKVLSQQMQKGADQLTLTYQERFVSSSQQFLDEWEQDLGLPQNVTGASIEIRRSRVNARRAKGAFTKTRREALLELFLQATIGTPIIFSPAGVAMTAGGLPLYGEGGVLSTLYRIYDDPATFQYYIRIINTQTPDLAGLTRELKRITPAGITTNIDNTVTNVLDWNKAVADLAPSGWWKLGADYQDYSGFAHHGTVTGAPTALASPGLNLAPGVADGARIFSGSGQYVTITDTDRLDSPSFTVMAIVRCDTLPDAVNDYQIIWDQGDFSNRFGINWNGTKAQFFFSVGTPTFQRVAIGSTSVVAGTTYHVAVKFNGRADINGDYFGIFVNGIPEAYAQFGAALYGAPTLGGNKKIGAEPGGGLGWKGAIDEVLYMGYPVEDNLIKQIALTTKNIA